MTAASASAGMFRLLACSEDSGLAKPHNRVSQFLEINLFLYTYTHTPPIGSVSLENPDQYREIYYIHE